MLSFHSIRTIVEKICVQNNADLALLFGSYARGTATEKSDIDLIFVEETQQPFLRRLDRYFDTLSDMLHSSIDIFVYNPKEFEAMKDSFFLQKALKEGIVLYESGKIRAGSMQVA